MSPSFITGSILAIGCHVIFVSHAAWSLDPLLYVSQFYPSYPTGITFVYVTRREPSFPTGYSLLISSQATPAGADLRWKGIVVRCMLIILINGSYVNNYVAPYTEIVCEAADENARDDAASGAHVVAAHRESHGHHLGGELGQTVADRDERQPFASAVVVGDRDEGNV